jgi:hypothetical protein
MEKKYNLFHNNNKVYYAGLSGQLIIKLEKMRWKIYEVNWPSKNQVSIGTIEKEIKNPEDQATIIGINPMTCDISGTRELFKLTNVSKKYNEMLSAWNLADHFLKNVCL